jgi:hypothetical protein
MRKRAALVMQDWPARADPDDSDAELDQLKKSQLNSIV